MKKLVKTVNYLPWMPQPGVARLYITDEIPSMEQCATAFGFVFVDEKILLTRLRFRDWDIPGGVIDPGETPGEAALREVWEETYAKVKIIGPIGIQEFELLRPKPEGYRWPYPISVQVYYLCELVELCEFNVNNESSERRFFSPQEARMVPTMVNHDLIYEEGLRRIRHLKPLNASIASYPHLV
jgi:8-oxo-dGTP pyrophosphatase MutT (NUDIX family)